MADKALKINYILHLNGFYNQAIADTRLGPSHLTIYLALFRLWNMSRFKHRFSITREQIMKASKIKSKTTYLKILWQLHK